MTIYIKEYLVIFKKMNNLFLSAMKYLCLFDSCGKYASFNYKNEKKKLYCTSHKLDGMVDVAHKKCAFDDCEKIPAFNYKGQKKLYSGDHKKEDYGIITRCWTSTHHFHKIQS